VAFLLLRKAKREMLLILLLRSDSSGFMQRKEHVFSEIKSLVQGRKLNKVQDYG
jgi:hypothetical protein